ncbi:hypothetical protein PIIN_11251, partial [Serendipita indica DSM 11827]
LQATTHRDRTLIFPGRVTNPAVGTDVRVA